MRWLGGHWQPGKIVCQPPYWESMWIISNCEFTCEYKFIIKNNLINWQS